MSLEGHKKIIDNLKDSSIETVMALAAFAAMMQVCKRRPDLPIAQYNDIVRSVFDVVQSATIISLAKFMQKEIKEGKLDPIEMALSLEHQAIIGSMKEIRIMENLVSTFTYTKEDLEAKKTWRENQDELLAHINKTIPRK